MKRVFTRGVMTNTHVRYTHENKGPSHPPPPPPPKLIQRLKINCGQRTVEWRCEEEKGKE